MPIIKGFIWPFLLQNIRLTLAVLLYTIIQTKNAYKIKGNGDKLMEQRKVFINPQNNLLQLEEPSYKLVEVDQPNTFRNLFPYDEIPKIAFNDRIVPHNFPDEIFITDTTFRDGQQSRAPYTTEQIVTIYD